MTTNDIEIFNNHIMKCIKQGLDEDIPESVIISLLEEHIQSIKSGQFNFNISTKTNNKETEYNYTDPSWYFYGKDIKR